MTDDWTGRRQVLATVGLTTAGLAGCGMLQSGGDSGGSEDGEDEPDETETKTPDPVKISGLRLSLTPETIETSDGSLERWADDSGNGNDFIQDTAEARPSVASGAANGSDALRFDGADDFLLREDTLGIADDSARTFVVVCRLADPTARSPYLMQGRIDSSGGGSSYYGLEANTFNTAGERFGVYLVSVAQDSERETNTAYNVHVIRTESFPDLSAIEGSTTYHVDGQQVSFSATPGNARNSQFEADSTAIGAFPQSAPESVMNGEIAEIAVYDRALDDDERTAIEEKLFTKYDISASN